MYLCNLFQLIAITINGSLVARQECRGKPYPLISIIIVITVGLLAQAV